MLASAPITRRCRTASRARWSSVNFLQVQVAKANLNRSKTPATKPMMELRELVEKNADADLLREMIGFAAERLMELEDGAGYHQTNPERKAQRNGYRERGWQTRAGNIGLRIPKLRTGGYLPPSRNCVGRLSRR